MPIGVDRGEEDKVTCEEDVGCPVICKSMDERSMLGELPERVDRCFYKFRPDPPFPQACRPSTSRSTPPVPRVHPP